MVVARVTVLQGRDGDEEEYRLFSCSLQTTGHRRAVSVLCLVFPRYSYCQVCLIFKIGKLQIKFPVLEVCSEDASLSHF